MRFDWDDKKNQLNIRKHGISFDLAMMVFMDDNRIEYYDEVHSILGEDRYIAIGMIRGYITVIYVVYTERADTIRIISARKATKMEEEAYYERIYIRSR